MQEILVDRRQLVLERVVEKFDDLGVALHVNAPVFARPVPGLQRNFNQRHRIAAIFRKRKTVKGWKLLIFMRNLASYC
jgi:hypothetical protein